MSPLQALFLIAWACVTAATAIHALLKGSQPASVWGWIAVSLLLPFAGPALYFVFGMNRIERRARRMRRPAPRNGAVGTEHEIDVRRQRPDGQAVIAPSLIPVARTGDVVTLRPLLDGNTLSLLHNGEEAFPRMLAAIDAAQRSIALMVYIFDLDRVGSEFIEALARAQLRGVDIRCLLDGVGEFGWRRAGSALRKRGVRVERFNPITLWPPFFHINLRNHRKILIVDGRQAFAGGMNVTAHQLAKDANNRHRATDIQVELTGPVVGQLAEVFAEDWRYASEETWAPEPLADLPAKAPAENRICRVVTDGPNEDLGKLSMVVLAAIAAARKHLFIVTPYFLPPPEMQMALMSAALRGVEVHVILPSDNNQPWTHFAARRAFPALLQAGVRIAYQPPPFCHAKLFVVDGEYAQFGSANFDTRSFRLNFEMMVEVYDSPFAAHLESHCLHLLAGSTAVHRRRLRAAELPARLRDAVCWLASPYL